MMKKQSQVQKKNKNNKNNNNNKRKQKHIDTRNNAKNLIFRLGKLYSCKKTLKRTAKSTKFNENPHAVTEKNGSIFGYKRCNAKFRVLKRLTRANQSINIHHEEANDEPIPDTMKGSNNSAPQTYFY